MTTETQIAEAVKQLKKSIPYSGERAAAWAIETILSAYQAEKERLDWLLKNGTLGIYSEKSKVMETVNDRSAIDQLRKDLK